MTDEMDLFFPQPRMSDGTGELPARAVRGDIVTAEEMNLMREWVAAGKPPAVAPEPEALTLNLDVEPATLPADPAQDTAAAPDYRPLPGLPHPYRLAIPEAWPPARSTLIGEGVVMGEAKTAGSKVGGAAGRWYTDKDGQRKFQASLDEHGRPKTFMKDSSGDAGKTWRSDVRDAVNDVLGHLDLATPIDAPLALEITFFAARLKGHYGSGRNAGVLKDSARLYPSVAPDAIKMTRAFEDALNKLLWADDSLNVDVLSRKRYTNGPPRAQWRLWALPPTVGDMRAAMQSDPG